MAYFRTITAPLLVIMALAASPAAAAPYTIFFYNTETSINNFSSLKGELDSYLSTFGAYEFQPFSDRQNFETFLLKRPPGLLLISSWHYRQLQSNFALEPVLVGTVQGRTTQRRILCAEKSITSAASLMNQKLASAGSEEYTREMLAQILGAAQQDIVDSVEILKVPKDIDGLMAIGFGVVKFALTTESNFETLAVVSPKDYRVLHVLGASEEILLPIVAVFEPADDNARQLVDVVEKMGDKLAGKRRLSMINLESMKKIGDLENGLLAP